MQIHKYERFFGNRTHQLNRVYSVRLSYGDISILNAHYPGESISFQIRSAINALQQHDRSSQGSCNTSSENM